MDFFFRVPNVHQHNVPAPNIRPQMSTLEEAAITLGAVLVMVIPFGWFAWKWEERERAYQERSDIRMYESWERVDKRIAKDLKLASGKIQPATLANDVKKELALRASRKQCSEDLLLSS
ncbi:hypothetical protein HRR78_007989 [Exophiala dermatitidis]|nr:hypothetical protein HRR75_007867 [Exophiala dermatitidis]KAJ4538652.1 hypothetical protein HRR78_007989 [Exophiala dermatitidis]